MVIKHPTSKYYQAKSGLKFFIIAEGVIFLSSYLIYAACNRSQKTRKYFYDHPYLSFITQTYYKIGEFHGTRTIEEYDQKTWAAQAKLEASMVESEPVSN